MGFRVLRTTGWALLLLAAWAARATGQQATTDELKRDIESLREALKDIQRDLQDIKGMLAARSGGSASLVNAVVDLATNPARGERTAKLTLVEFSDYQ